MRRFLAIVFLTIFTIQVLPLKVIGKLLSKNQNMEEVQDDAEDGTSPEGKVMKFGTDDQIEHQHFFDFTATTRCFNDKLTAFIHRSESLPAVHIAAMPAPPPDRLA